MRAPAMRRQETRVILGSKMKLALRRITRAANFIGWKYVVTCDNHLICRGFTNTLELDRAFDRAELRARAAIESNQQDLRFEAIYEKWSKMPEHGRHAVACYMLGLMSKSMIDFHLNKFDEQVNEFNKIHEEMEKEEEVDVSDCCHSEDVKSVQPPCRSSVQSSPDDPYYICGSCEQKCEIETWTRKDLEEKE